MTGQPKIVASEGLGEVKFEQALARCPFRSICGPSSRSGADTTTYACVTLLGPPAPLHAELLDRLQADVAQGRTFMIAAEYEATSLLVAVPVGRA